MEVANNWVPYSHQDTYYGTNIAKNRFYEASSSREVNVLINLGSLTSLKRALFFSATLLNLLSVIMTKPLQLKAQSAQTEVVWRKPMQPEKLQKIRAVFDKARSGIIRTIMEQRLLGTNGL